MSEPSDTFDGREERLHRLLELGRALTSELRLDAVLEQILETARSLTGARYAAVGILDERRRGLAEFITSGADADTARAIGHLPRGHGILGLLIDEPEPIRLHDVSEHPRSYGFPLGHPPMHGFLGAPIRIRGEAWGNIYLTEKADGSDFDDDDVWAIVVLADWAAVAIDNARLFQESEARRTELERAVRGMEASADIALAVGGEADLDRILELITKRARALVEADALLILLRDGDELRVAAHAGNAHPEPGAALPIAGSTSGEALQTQRPQRVDDARDGLAVDSGRFGVPDARTALIVPLVFRGRALGVLTAVDHIGARTEFDEDDERALRAFAASAATAVSAARTVEEQRLRDSVAAAESERKRWARDLHDETLQGMGAIKLALAAALRSGGPVSAETVAATVELLDQEIAGLRAIITDLRPAALDELGLEPALRTLAGRIAEREGLELETTFDLGDDRLPADVENVAYRVTQEALNNVARHAQAGRCEVAATRDGAVLRLRVSDDGCGFTQGREGGFGLLGMRERATLAGGELEIEPANPGTRVTLTLPIVEPLAR
jgi:signal transduction histidine kinase